MLVAWTEDRVEILTKLWAEGLSASQIAKQLGGVTRNAVIGKVHRLGLSGRAKPSRPSTARKAKPRTAASKPASKPRIIRAGSKSASRSASSTSRRGAISTPKREKTVAAISMPPPIEAKPLPNGEFATILTIRDHMCKWPIGDPSSDDFRFCGRKSADGSPYCEAHSAVAFQPARRRGEAPKALPPRRNKYLPKR